jgi:curved DNA-binding protein
VARDYYRTLGVDRGATDAEIKRAYRKLARELHPDVTGDDPRATERFKAVTEAWEVLSDPSRRKSYDLFGTKDAPPPPGPTIDLDSLLDQVFPGRKKKPRPEPGTDTERTIRITLPEAWTGATRALDGGLSVVVPAGIDDGARLRLKGKGTKGTHGAPDGDLYVVVRVEEHPRFARDGNELLLDVAVPLSAALLGGTVDVALPDGSVRVTIAAGTHGGQTLRLRGKGFAKVGAPSSRGDALVTVQIRIPRVPDADRDVVAALLQRWQSADPGA